jgi:hypothetical protein
MALYYANLDAETRGYMLQEFYIGPNYESPRLLPGKQPEWLSLLESAIREYDDEWLEATANRLGLLATAEVRRGKIVRVPANASQTLSEGEFNHYYLRGIAARATAHNRSVRFYRGKEVDSPRLETQAMIGCSVDPRSLLIQLRTNPFEMFGPNSGLTAEIV